MVCTIINELYSVNLIQLFNESSLINKRVSLNELDSENGEAPPNCFGSSPGSSYSYTYAHVLIKL
jgi:hypothetical protein